MANPTYKNKTKQIITTKFASDVFCLSWYGMHVISVHALSSLLNYVIDNMQVYAINDVYTLWILLVVKLLCAMVCET